MEKAVTAPRVIAVFDFDNTLIKGDSLWPFLGRATGWLRTYAALTLALVHYIQHRHEPEAADARTFIKAELLRHLLASRKTDTLTSAIQSLYQWQEWNPPILAALREHHEKGHHIVIASGGLDLYLPSLLKNTPHDALICTQVHVTNGVITGDMPNGNCVRARKAELVKEYMEKNGPFGESWGYGNYPHDVPMLGLLKHRILV
jgi:HAD superfamily phosphoserine phosphatase-like hydrolase